MRPREKSHDVLNTVHGQNALLRKVLSSLLFIYIYKFLDNNIYVTTLSKY